MNIRNLCGLGFAAAAVTMAPSSAMAQSTTVVEQPAPATTVVTQPAPVSNTTVVTPGADTGVRRVGPSVAMISSGISVMALSYIPVAIVGATSPLDADRALFVPIAGPWIDLSQRRACGPTSSCDSENTAKVLLVTDGIFQGIGALTFVGGFFTTHETHVVQESHLGGPTIHLSPAKLPGSGYGVLASGTF